MDAEQTIAQVLSFLKEFGNGNNVSSSPTAATEQETNSAAIISPVFYKLYSFTPDEVSNEISDSIRNFLEERKCPHLVSLFLARSLSEQVQDFVQGQGDVDMTSILNILPSRFQLMIDKLLNEPSFETELKKLVASEQSLPYDVSAFAIRNKRRKMEDKHVVIQDLNTLLGLKTFSAVNSYYAVFDGHAGIDAASYAAAHLHVNLVKDPDFFDDPHNAMENAYRVTDKNFCKKALTDGIKSGCTAITALIRDKTLVLAWLGDSQAVLIEKGVPITIMNPHKPNRQDEKERIERLGGFVHHIGTWRVNGSLAVSRALGDYEMKPFVSSEPESNVISLKGTEDFLVLACDGLWDSMTPKDVASMLYRNLNENVCASVNADTMAEKLVHQAKQLGSDDNITVLVVYLRSIPEISADKEQRDLQQTVNETNVPITGEVHCPQRPKVLENIISFPSLCPKSEDEQSSMPTETEPTEFSELPTPPIDEIKNHFSEYYSHSRMIEKSVKQEEKDSSSHNIDSNNSDQAADVSGDLFDLLTDPTSEVKCKAPVLDTNYSATEFVTEHFESTTVVEKIESTFESIHSQLNPEAAAFVPKLCNVKHSPIMKEVKAEEFGSVEIEEMSMHSVEKLESSELSINVCVENQNIKNLQHSMHTELVEITTDDRSENGGDSRDVIEQIEDHMNFLAKESSAQNELIELPVAQECLTDQLTETVSNTGFELLKEEIVSDNQIPEESMGPVIVPQADIPSIVSEISQKLDDEKVDNLMNVVNDAIQHSDASSTEFAVAVDLQSVPDGIPEAEGVCEDIDSDSEKDGGWSYMKPADNILEGVGQIAQSSEGIVETSSENTEVSSNKIKLESVKSSKTATIKQRMPRADQQKKADSAMKSTVPVKRSPVLPKMPIKAAGLTNTASQAQASKTSRTLQSAKVPPITKTKMNQVSVTDSLKNATKSNISVAAKKETASRNVTKPTVPAVKKDICIKAAPTKTSLTAPKTTSPALHKTASPVLHKARSPAAAATQKTSTVSSPVPKSMPQYLKSKPATSPSGVKPSNPVSVQKVGLSSTVQKPTVKKFAAVQKSVGLSSRNGISKPNPPVGSVEAKAMAPKRNLQASKPNPEIKETKNAMNKQLVARKTGLPSTVQSKMTTGDAKKLAIATTAKTASAVIKSKKITTTSTVSQSKKPIMQQQQLVTKKNTNCKSSVIKEGSSIISDNGNQQADAVELCNEESKSSTEKFNLECDIKESPLVDIDKSQSAEVNFSPEIPQDPVVASPESAEVLETEGILSTNVENVEN